MILGCPIGSPARTCPLTLEGLLLGKEDHKSKILPIFVSAMRFFATALLLCGVVASEAQTPQVPHRIHFAGMTLVIHDDARAEIQKDVDALTQSPKYFNIKVERARTYFPTIERIFLEERVPVEFKYLVLQESALIADAVSVSDAVGFWQFKDFTAREMGLRVDQVVDERMNITASTRAAARYIKQNNYMFNNWVYALQAYQMGAGGVKRMVGDELDGSRKMDITAGTYWYVKKFLAHMVAFESAVTGMPQVKIAEQDITTGGSLSIIAEQISIDNAKLKEFNKWIRKDEIPSDKSYTVIVPVGESLPDFSKLYTVAAAVETTKKPGDESISKQEILINNIPVIQAGRNESLEALAQRSGLSMSHFLKYNELPPGHRVVPGGYYFVAKKKSRTVEEYHKVRPGEDLWTVSQLHGIHVKRLRKLNNLGEGEQPSVGTMIWLNTEKPDNVQTIDSQADVLEVEDQFIEWTSPRASATPRPEASGVHVVRQGETLYAISKMYSTPVEDLVSLNSLAGTDLKPGQQLTVVKQDPAFVSIDQNIVHEVQLSETLYSVARRYGVSVKELMDSNNKTDFSVALGEKLKIPAR